jgi:hypothetical protein
MKKFLLGVLLGSGVTAFAIGTGLGMMFRDGVLVMVDGLPVIKKESK